MITPISGPTTLRVPTELPGANAPSASPRTGTPTFGESVKEFLGAANDLSLRSEETFQAFVRGEVRDLHQVSLAQQEAGLAVRLVTEMRDKLLQSYQEIMRMQM